MRKFDLLRTTSNPRMYKIIYLDLEPRHCNFCAPNRGCNRHINRHANRSWKEYRRTQWRE